MFFNKFNCILIILLICSSILYGQLKKVKSNANVIDSPKNWDIGKVILPKLNIPDSLGGENLKGYIILLLYVNKNGDKVGFEIQQIFLTNKVGENIKKYNRLKSLSEGDSLLTLYLPWVKSFYDSIKFQVNKNSYSFEKQDTVSTLETIVFNRRKTNVLRIDNK